MHASEKIKLLEFVTLFHIGGTERHVVNLVKRIDDGKFDLQVACLCRSGEFLPEIESVPLTEFYIESLYGRAAFGQQVKFGRHLKQNRIQIVHTYGFYPNLFAIPAAWFSRVPVIVASIRDTGAYLTPGKKRAQKMVCRLADRIVVNAEAVRNWLIEEGFNPKKITVIHNGIDVSRFQKKRSGSRLRQDFGLSPHSPIIAVISRLNPLKGIHYFLDAAAQISRRFPEARFLIIGDSDEYRKELEDCAGRLGIRERVIFTGFRLDIAELLSEISISVLPSLTEGLSNTLLESMAAGVPVVATEVGGNPELVQDGITGLLVPPRDPGALARAISLLLEKREMALQFGHAGRERAAKLFSLEKMVAHTERLYLELLERAECTQVVRAKKEEGGLTAPWHR
ncbi:MAG: GT4 family glycosyltransferase PelF [Deltaproteobacteria bacterium]|nr:GT4 family glycosyltransferase PelF [Deltaproteobacteria bacterium]